MLKLRLTRSGFDYRLRLGQIKKEVISYETTKIIKRSEW